MSSECSVDIPADLLRSWTGRSFKTRSPVDRKLAWFLWVIRGILGIPAVIDGEIWVCAGKGVEFTYSDPEECAGWYDPASAERVLVNLLFNAGEAVAPVGGKIHVTARNSERGVVIEIADNGPGIPDSIRENLFQPFISAGKEKGIGLGLTVVRKIMHDHGGEVSIPKTGPEGTVFELIFPNATPEQTKTTAPDIPSIGR